MIFKMIVKFRNPDEKIHKTYKNLENSLQFYPLYVHKEENLYGLIFVPKRSEKDVTQLFSCNLFEILDSTDENVLFFKTRYPFQFYPSSSKIMKPFILKNGFVYFFTSEDENWNGNLPIEYLDGLDFECESFHDDFTHDLNLLGTLAMSAKYLDEKERESLILAINFGYPVYDVIDFQGRGITNCKDEILRKWVGKEAFTYEEPEKNFVELLQRSAKKLIQNNMELFERISLCNRADNSSFTAKSFLKLMEVIPPKERIYSEKTMPKLFVDEIVVEGILAAKKEKKDDLQRNISNFLENYPIRSHLISEWKDERLPDSFMRYRLAFLWDISSERVLISELVDYAEELKELVLAALRKTDRDAFSRSLKRKQRFWIRSIDISLLLPIIFSDTAIEIIRGYFAFFLHKDEKSQLIRKKFIGNEFCLSFRVRYPIFHDYQISRRKFGYFYEVRAIDELTRQGIELARQHSFSRSLTLFEKGSHAIRGDILVWKSKLKNGQEKTQFLREAEKHYRLAGLLLRPEKDEISSNKRKNLKSSIIFFSNFIFDLIYKKNKKNILIEKIEEPLYLPQLDPVRLLVAQQDNYDWRIAVESYLIGKNMRDDILADQLEHNGEDSEKRKLANMYLAYSGLCAKDSVCLVEDLGVFYARLVSEIQRKFGDLTAEWLGFNF